MYIIKNALKNLARNRGRNLLLGAILLAIVTTTVVTLSITKTTDAIIADYEQRFSSEVFIEVDMDAFIANLMEQRQAEGGGAHSGGGIRIGGPGSLPSLDPDLILDIVASPYLADYNLQAAIGGANSTQLQALDQDSPDFLNMLEQPMLELDEYGRLLVLDENDELNFSEGMGLFSIMGGQWADFESGTRTLLEGEMPVEYGQALMSQDLADLNGLSVGDTFEMNHFLAETREYITREFELTGIYLTVEEDNPFAFMMGSMPFMNRDNEILTTFDTALFPETGGSAIAQLSGSYYLDNPDDLDAFEAYARNLGLSDDFVVRTDEAAYQAIVAPVLGLGSVTQTFLWVVLILGGVILTLLSSIAIRERKYEIGVLRAMGMKKAAIAKGFLTETIILTALCVVVGLGVGSAAAQPVSDALLAVQLESLPDQSDEGFGGFGGGGARIISTAGGTQQSATPDPIDALDIQLSGSTIFEIVGISLVLSMIASGVSLGKITKYEPIKILMERN